MTLTLTETEAWERYAEGTEVELAWAAGLFEGEGYITLHNRHQRATALRMGLKMADEACVRRFAHALGVGIVRGPLSPPSKKPQWSVMWEWVCIRDTEVEHALGLLWPNLSERRRARAAELRLQREDALRYRDVVCRCGRPFRAIRYGHRYCSATCRVTFWRQAQP